MANPPIVCETSRLILRHFTMDDFEPLAAMHSDPEVSRFLGGVKTKEQTHQRLLEWLSEYERYGFSKWAVILRATGELVGRCGLSPEEIDGVSDWELGWAFGAGRWGKGCGAGGRMGGDGSLLPHFWSPGVDLFDSSSYLCVRPRRTAHGHAQ